MAEIGKGTGSIIRAVAGRAAGLNVGKRFISILNAASGHIFQPLLRVSQQNKVQSLQQFSP